MCGFIAQLVEQRTGNAEVTGSNPVETLIFFFRFLLFNCLNWKKFTAMIILHFHLQPQFKNELFHILHINIFLIIKNTFQVKTWAICCLSDSKTQERGLKELNTKTFLGEPAPQTPIDSACAFGSRLGNRSVVIPDPRPCTSC